MSSIAIDYVRKFPRLRKLGVGCLSLLVLFSLMFMIHLRGQSLVLSLRRIWAIKPYKSIGDYEVAYDYLEDFEEEIRYKAKEDEAVKEADDTFEFFFQQML